MGQGIRAAGGPSRTAPATLLELKKRVLDAELLELERRKLIELRRGTIVLTREGYRLLVHKCTTRP